MILPSETSAQFPDAAATARAEKLPQAILSKAFQGELVPTEAELARAEGRSFETAEEMLARVAASSCSPHPAQPLESGARRSGDPESRELHPDP